MSEQKSVVLTGGIGYKVHVSGANKVSKALSARLHALAQFLRKYLVKGDDEEIVVDLHVFIPPVVGGLRVGEITVSDGVGGSSIQRCNRDSMSVILAAEDFLLTHGTKSFRPANWESHVNLHGEAKCNILAAMGMNEDEKAEYKEQVAEEKKEDARNEEGISKSGDRLKDEN